MMSANQVRELEREHRERAEQLDLQPYKAISDNDEGGFWMQVRPNGTLQIFGFPNEEWY